jgi:hypothetical protein
MSETSPETPAVVEVEVPSVDESAYPARPYAEAVSDEHRQFLAETAPEQAV